MQRLIFLALLENAEETNMIKLSKIIMDIVEKELEKMGVSVDIPESIFRNSEGNTWS